ncbi:MAG: sporulation protein YqfC [Acetivibrionales bacterium]|jgi:sporulation protein YqfC
MKKNKALRDKSAGREGVKSEASGKRKKNSGEDGIRGKSMKEKFTEVLELPKELVMDIPRITIVGKGDMMIENYKGVIEYGSSRIRINTGAGMVRISGAGLVIREITSEDIIISGGIQSLEYV